MLTGRHQTRGINFLKPEQGIRAFEYALKQDNEHLIVADMDWKLFLRDQKNETGLLSEFMPSKKVAKANLLSQLQKAAPDQRKDILFEHVSRIAKEILGMPQNTVLNEDQGFMDIGMDSLMAVEFKNKLQGEIGKEYLLSSTLTFDYPSIKLMVHYLNQLFFPKESAEMPEKAMQEAKKDLTSMTKDEIKRIIKGKK